MSCLRLPLSGVQAQKTAAVFESATSWNSTQHYINQAPSATKLYSLNANISSGQSKNSNIFLSKSVLMKTSARLWQAHSQPDILGEDESKSRGAKIFSFTVVIVCFVTLIVLFCLFFATAM